MVLGGERPREAYTPMTRRLDFVASAGALFTYGPSVAYRQIVDGRDKD
jgi:hypothetical protein